MPEIAADERPETPADEKSKRNQLRLLLTDRLIEAVQDPKVRASTLAVAVRFLSECGSIDDLPPTAFDETATPTPFPAPSEESPAQDAPSASCDGLPFEILDED